MHKQHHIAFLTLTCLAAAAVTGGVYIAGFFLSAGDRTVWLTLAAVTGAALLALAVVNVVGAARMKKKWENIPTKQGMDYVSKLKNEIERDYEKAEQNVDRTVAASYVYLAALICLFLFGVFCLGMTGLDFTYMIACVLLAVYAEWCFLNILTAPTESPVPETGTEIQKSEFPRIYATAERAAAASQCVMPVRLFITGGGIAVSEYGGVALVLVNVAECAVLTEAELYNIMLHEFGHIMNVDTKRSLREDKITSRWGSNAAVDYPIWQALLSHTTMRMLFALATYGMISSRYRETLADDAVKRLGQPLEYVNATAKACMMNFCREMPQREMRYDFYAEESAPTDAISREIALYRRCVRENGARWKALLLKELPARMDSHPTLKMRMEHMEQSDFDHLTAETDDVYIAEQNKLVAFADKLVYDFISPDYMSEREDNYVRRNKVFAAYEEAAAAGRVPEHLRVKAMRAWYGVDNDKALAIADSLLAERPDSASANFCKGLILFYRDDPECVGCFYTVARKSGSGAQAAMDYVGRFALKTGDKEMLEKYRADAPELVQKDNDFRKYCVWDEKRKLSAPSLPAETIAEIAAALAEIGNGMFAKLRMAEFTAADGSVRFPVLAEFADDAPMEGRYEIFDDCITYLDDRNEYFSFGIAAADKKLAKAMDEIADTVIYTAPCA